MEALADLIYDDRFEEFQLRLVATPAAELSNYQFSDGSTLLAIAVEEKRPRFVSALLEAGADPNVVLPSGATALALAAYFGERAGIVELLLRAGAHTDQGTAGEGYTPLTLAVERGDLATCTLLLDAGAPVEEDNNHHMTPLMQACLRRDLAMVEVLLSRGASPRHGADGTDPLEAAGDHAAIRALLLAR